METELETLREAKLSKKGVDDTSSAVEAGESLGESDKEPCTPVEPHSRDCDMEKTETVEVTGKAVVNHIEPLAECMKEEFDETLKECDEKVDDDDPSTKPMEEDFDTALKSCGDEKESDEKVDDDDYFGSDSKDEGSESGSRFAMMPQLKDIMSFFNRELAEMRLKREESDAVFADKLHRLEQKYKK